MSRPIELSRQEAEYLVDKLEETPDIPQWMDLAQELRDIWGMVPQENRQK